MTNDNRTSATTIAAKPGGVRWLTAVKLSVAGVRRQALDPEPHRQFSIWLREATTVWAFPAVLSCHTVGMGLVAGISTAIDLRILDTYTNIYSLSPLPLQYEHFPIYAARLKGVSPHNCDCPFGSA